MTEQTTPKVDQLIAAYIDIRDQVAKLEAEHKKTVAPYKEAMGKIEGTVLTILNNMGVDSFKTPAGTAYSTTRTSVTVADRAAFMDYVVANQQFDLLDVRPNKTAVQGFLEAHQDLPPGVNVSRAVACNFRRD